MPSSGITPRRIGRWILRAFLTGALGTTWVGGVSAQDADPWTPGFVVAESRYFQPVNYQGEPVPPPSPGTPPSETSDDTANPGEEVMDVFSDFQETTQINRLDNVPPAFEATVTSVTGNVSSVGKSPAAIFVINQEMIRRSGAQTLPEVLRMVPGVHVGSGNAVLPNVSIRGFGTGTYVPFSTRVLVLIDGRSIYDPTLGGLIWTTNDVVLQDVERIEVIRGPGATIWGANAVNGVINVITKSAKETQGTMLTTVGGSEYHNLTTARHGMKVGDDGYLRVWGKFREIDEQYRNPKDAQQSFAFRNEPANDNIQDYQLGFRLDKQLESGDQLSVQGRMAAFPGDSVATANPPADYLLEPNPTNYFAGSIQASWTHELDAGGELTVQGIYDRTDNGVSLGQLHRDTYMLDATYRRDLNERHRLVASGQFRLDRDTVVDVDYPFFRIGFDPASRTYNVVSWLVQDEITLIPDELTFLAGAKMEVNPFTGFEIQPSGRLLKVIDERRALWGSVSRAIRRPSRLDEHLNAQILLPNRRDVSLLSIQGSADYRSESLVALETGYRAQPIDELSWDVTCFSNLYYGLPIYDDVRDGRPGFEVAIENGARAQSYGAELSATIDLTETWKVTGAYSYLRAFADIYGYDQPISGLVTERFYETNQPSNLVYVRNSWTPNPRWNHDLIHRYVDQVAFGGNPAYFEMDYRVAWRPRERLEIAVVGQNLLDHAHAEFGTREYTPLFPVRTQIQRGVYGSVTYEF